MKKGTLSELIPKSKHIFVLTGLSGSLINSELFLKEYASAVAIEYTELNGVITDGMETFYVLGTDPTFDSKEFAELMKKAE